MRRRHRFVGDDVDINLTDKHIGCAATILCSAAITPGFIAVPYGQYLTDARHWRHSCRLRGIMRAWHIGRCRINAGICRFAGSRRLSGCSAPGRLPVGQLLG